jgi:hypothetical protein
MKSRDGNNLFIAMFTAVSNGKIDTSPHGSCVLVGVVLDIAPT